jgi:transcriptional regulator with XRE-family HTH domain
MISVVQIKAARAMLGWSATYLAERIGASPATIKRYELQEGIPAAKTIILHSIQSVLEEAGIEFTGDPVKNPGVVLHIRR